MRARITTAIGLAAALAACSKDKESKKEAAEEPTAKVEQKEEPKAPDKPAEPPPKKGRAADGNDAAVVATVEKVVADCAAHWEDRKGFAWDCAAYKGWMEQENDWAKITPTLLNLIEDPEAKVRNLAWKALSRGSWGAAFRTDKALAERVLGAAEAETSPAIDGEIGVLVAGIELDKLGLMERVVAHLGKPNVPEDFRRGVVTYVFSGSPESEAGYQLLRAEIARTTNAGYKKDLLGSLSTAGIHADEVCATWRELWNGSDAALKTEAAARITRGHTGTSFQDPDTGWFSSSSGTYTGPNPCAADIDAVLAHVESLATSGTIADYYLIDSLSGLLWDDTASQPHKDRAIAIAKAVVENPANQNRYGALNLVIQKAPDGKDYARKFESDADEGVKQLAVSANKPA